MPARSLAEIPALAAVGPTPAAGPEVAARLFRALGDPTRLGLLVLLAERGELTVGELTRAVGGLQGRVSSHLACLRHCGLVSTRREGRTVRYRLADDRVRVLLRTGLALAGERADHIATCHRIDTGGPEPGGADG